ncbi:hypothetical protein HF877_06170 [Rhodococcus sp. BL-253-APC-6A1W]|uniref:hypothetical protein n=1 Tax=Rhodococcus sp. BL-253-APC-6A1W TaxID=2725307 RepID=UPI00146CF3CA|nr:hypothetical protein [Rhodococcus sp. BL-253-APC-6A1W]NMD94989.1 hypothetical protein [Rhodococcus sp. BL-253-APC-6A1W]
MRFSNNGTRASISLSWTVVLVSIAGRAAIPKIAPGGMLFLDDSDRPRYNPLVRELASWNRADYRGLKRAGDIAQSTIWTRP